jgi:hypothetical protein
MKRLDEPFHFLFFCNVLIEFRFNVFNQGFSSIILIDTLYYHDGINISIDLYLNYILSKTLMSSI